MSIISFINQKGGCSKSTTAVHFAVWLHKRNKKVVLVDADAQCSSSKWLNSMSLGIKNVALSSPDEILEKVNEIYGDADYLVIDGPAGLSEIIRAILLVSDFAVVPCQPTGLDLHSALDTVRLIKQAQSVRGGLPGTAFFLSRAIKNTRLKSEAIALLSKNKDIALMNSVIHQSQIIADTRGQDSTIWDGNLSIKEASKSRKEYKELFEEILSLLNHE